MRDSRRYATARSARRFHTALPGADDTTSISSADSTFLRKLIKTGDSTFVDSLLGRRTGMQPDLYPPLPPPRRRRIPRPCLYILMGMMLMYLILYIWEQRHTIQWLNWYKYQLKYSIPVETKALPYYNSRDTRVLAGGAVQRKNNGYESDSQVVGNGMMFNQNDDYTRGDTSINNNNQYGIAAGANNNPVRNNLRDRTPMKQEYDLTNQGGYDTSGNEKETTNSATMLRQHQSQQIQNPPIPTVTQNNQGETPNQRQQQEQQQQGGKQRASNNKVSKAASNNNRQNTMSATAIQNQLNTVRGQIQALQTVPQGEIVNVGY